MKAKLYDQVKTLVDISADFNDQMIPTGTLGTVIECYKDPEGYAVDLVIPASTNQENLSYQNVILSPDQFMVASSEQSSHQSVQPSRLKSGT